MSIANMPLSVQTVAMGRDPAEKINGNRHGCQQSKSPKETFMIDAYLAGGTNAQRVSITLEETGLPYQMKKLSHRGTVRAHAVRRHHALSGGEGRR
jgi:hypothetical protein